MYLSKATLKPSADTAKILLEIPGKGEYATHQLIWKLFTEEKNRNFIYREDIGFNGQPEYYLLSQNQPKDSDEIFYLETKKVEPKLKKDQRLAFSLRVNPTISIQDGKKSRRHDVMMHAKKQFRQKERAAGDCINLYMEQAALDWITNEQRLERWGVRLDSVPTIERYHQHKGIKPSGNSIRFSSVDYQGVFTVIDPERFIGCYKNGFGPAKSMGCGLMLIRKI